MAVATACQFAVKLEGVISCLFRLESLPAVVDLNIMAPAMLHPYTPDHLMPMTMSMQIMGDDDIPVMIVGGLLNTVNTLKAEMDKFKLDVVTRGGVSF